MAEARTIEIPAPNFREILVTVKGRTPGLLTDRYGERTREVIKHREAHPNQKQEKVARDPEAEFRGALYVVADANGKRARYGIPAAAFHKAMISAGGRFAGLKNMGPTLAGAITVEADLIELRASEPVMREDPRSIKGQRSSLIYRAWFHEWEADLPIRFDADLFTEAQVLNLIARAGEQVGVGNWRPEKKGNFGRFEIVGGKA
jgi:hypothetical protein